MPLEGEIGRVMINVRLAKPRIFISLISKPPLPFCQHQVIGEQEANARVLGIVDGFKLMRQRINTSDGESEVGVVFVGKSETHCLNT